MAKALKFLTPVQAADVERLCREKRLTKQEVANLYDISVATVRRMAAGTWRPRLPRFKKEKPAQQLELSAPETYCAVCGVKNYTWSVKVQVNGRAGRVCYSCMKVTMERAARKGLIALPLLETKQYYVLKPEENRWEEIDPDSITAGKILNNEIPKVQYYLHGPYFRIKTPPQPGRYFVFFVDESKGQTVLKEVDFADLKGGVI